MITAVTQWHKHPTILSLGETPLGKLMIWLSATAMLWWHGVTLLLPVTIILVSLAPKYRHQIVALAAVGAITEYSLKYQFAGVGIIYSGALPLLAPSVQVILILGLLYILYQLIRCLPKWPSLAQRFPVIILHAGMWMAMSLSGQLPFLGSAIVLGPWLIWRVSYMAQLSSRKRFEGTSFADHLMYLWPVFGGNQPQGKGYEYLSQHEVDDASQLARSQISGLKLLMMAAAWQVVIWTMDTVVFATPPDDYRAAGWVGMLQPLIDIPRLSYLIADSSATSGIAWASTLLELVRVTLVIALRGHIIIGCLRLMGFNVFRNTYKPLLSESVLEFWNRFNFYFKELMVEFFFYPVFLRCSRVSAGLRLFLAVFAAACIGNMYFHMLLDPRLILTGDLVRIWEEWGARLVYCVCLATGVWVSMMQQQKRRRLNESHIWYIRLRRIAAVCLFFAVINIWDTRAPGAAMSDRALFCLKLLGIH